MENRYIKEMMLLNCILCIQLETFFQSKQGKLIVRLAKLCKGEFNG